VSALENELYAARKNFVFHMSGRAHQKYGRTPDPTNCYKCQSTLARIAEAERAIERAEIPDE
jgi:hypothetical protein